MHLLDPAHIPAALRAFRAAIFPHDALGPPRPIPPPGAQRHLRRRAARALLDVMPPRVARWFFAARISGDPDGGDGDGDGARGAAPPPDDAASGADAATDRDADPERERMLRELEAALDVFGDEYMNRRVAFAVVELVLVRLMPELAEKGARELLAEKMGPAAWAELDGRGSDGETELDGL